MCGYNRKGCTEGTKKPSLFIKHEYIHCMYVHPQVRVKQESVNDEMRTKSTVVTMNDLDLLDECNQMIAAINKYH